jgi:excisionase family DNA binding protein
MTPAELLEQPTLSVGQAAEVVGVGRATVYEAIRAGSFPGVLRVGRRIRISTAALRRWLEAEGDVAPGEVPE